MQFFIIVLRILHIFGGVFWVGAAVLHFFFLAPAAAATAPESGKFMQGLMGRQKFPAAMGLTSLVTVLSGAILLWIVSGGLSLGWLSTGPGIGLLLSSIAALIAFVIGSFVISPAAKKMGETRAAFQPTGPSPEQIAQVNSLDHRIHSASRIELYFMLFGLLGMAVSRYLYF